MRSFAALRMTDGKFFDTLFYGYISFSAIGADIKAIRTRFDRGSRLCGGAYHQVDGALE